MKKLLPILAATTLIITGCSSDNDDATEPSTQAADTPSAENNDQGTPKAVELSLIHI